MLLAIVFYIKIQYFEFAELSRIYTILEITINSAGYSNALYSNFFVAS